MGHCLFGIANGSKLLMSWLLESLKEPEADQGLGRVVNFIRAGSRKPVYQNRQNPGKRQENGQTESTY